MIRSKITFVIFFLTLCKIVSATNYYVSSSVGNDALDGKSIANAWKTISKVNASNFLPGDSILFKKGDVWRETLNIPSSGNSGAYIVFAAYGTGAKPKILGSTKAITWTNVSGNIWTSATSVTDPYNTTSYAAEIFFEEPNGTVTWGNPKKTYQAGFGNLTVEYDWTWYNNHVYIYAATNPDNRYSAIEVPQIDDIIYLNSKDYITIYSLDLRYCILAGIKAAYAVAQRHGLEVNYCDISYIGYRGSEVGYGISAWYSNSWYHHNLIHDTGRRGVDINCQIDGQTEDNVLIEYNEIYGTHHTGVDCATGNAATISNITIRCNRIYELDNYPFTSADLNILPIYISKESGNASVSNIWVYDNIITGGRRGDINITGTTNVYVYNNVIINSAVAYECQIVLISTTNTILKNNIIVNKTPAAATNKNVWIVSGNTGYILNYNLYYAENANTNIIQGPSGSYTMAQWSSYKSATGQDANSPTPSDPLFVSSSDLHVQPGSPAIGAGVAIPEVTTDFEGIAFTNPPNIGCYATPVMSNNPVYLSSVVENATPSLLAMTYNKTLANVVPAVTAFSVMVNAVARTVSTVSVSGTKVQLTLASPIVFGDVITVSYTKPASNPLQISTGEQAASISSKPVTNNVSPTIPVYVSSVIANATPSLLTMTYNLTLTNIIPAASAFTVMVNSVARTITSVAISGTNVLLTLASPVISGDAVTVAYTQPATNPLQTASGGKAVTISAQPVTNNVNPAVPMYVSSVIGNATPALLTITYNLTLANIVPAASAFTVMVNSVARTVTTVAISGTNVQLTLATPVVYGDIVSVAYTKPSVNPLQTTSGSQAATIGLQSVTNNVNPAVPTYVSSVIGNTAPALLTMTYSLNLANIVPATSAFTVMVNSVARTITTVAISGTNVLLTLANPVVYGDIVTVAYSKPVSNPLQTASGGQAPTIGPQSVTNNVNSLVPVYVSSVVGNATPTLLTMTYSLNLANIVPAASAFIVIVNSVARTVTTVSVSGTNVMLTLATPVVYGDIVTVAYTKPSTNPLQTSSGDQAATISAQSVINNVNSIVPTYVSSVIENASPGLLTMTYSLNLANLVPAASAFTVRVNSVRRTVSTVAISGTNVQLTLTNPVVYGDIVTVAYTKPATNPLQTPSGGQAATISAQSVINNVNSPVPTYVSSAIQNATPSLLTMTYDLSLANIIPAALSFAVRVNSVTRAISAVAISGINVQLTLATPVAYGDIVTVAYTRPAINPLQSTLGVAAVSISAQTVTNNCILPVPVYLSSVIEDATPNVLQIAFDLNLANIIPSASAFRVRVNSVTRAVTSVAISGTNVMLTLASRIVYGDVVTVAYNRPSNRPLQTPLGGRVASFSAKPVTNNVKVIVAPVYVSSVIQDATPNILEMTYDITLANIVPESSAFTVLVNSIAGTINAVVISGTKVILTLASPAVYGDIVTVAYAKPSVNPLQTSQGGQAATIGPQPVTNNINNITSINNPVYASSVVENATPNLLVMTYDRTLNNSIVPPTSAFSVMVNSISISVTNVAIIGNDVQLTLADTILYGDVVAVSYTKPESNQIQTDLGGQAASISNQPVINNAVLVNVNYPPVPVIEYATIGYSGFISDIDATKSYDLDNDSLIFLWTAPDSVSISSTSASKIQFLAPLVQQAKIIEFTMSVSDGEAIQTQTIPITILPYKPELSVAKAIKDEASNYDIPNYPGNIIDNNPETEWSSNGNGQWLILELSKPYNIDHLGITFPSGLNRSAYFDIYASKDTLSWEPVLIDAVSCSFSGNFQVFIFPESKTSSEYSFIKLVGHGSSVDSWNDFSEFQIFGRPHVDAIQMTLYPNPAHQLINISIDYPTDIPNEESLISSPIIRIFNTSGMLVIEELLEPGVNNVQIPINLKTGVYIVQLLSDKITIAANKLVVIN